MTDPRLVRPTWRDGRTNLDALTIACIEHAEKIGGHTFTVTQGSYQGGGGEELSAGTHDRGGAVDLRWCGHDRCIRALRQAGMAAWHRTPAQGPWPDHIHAVVIGHPDLAPSAARQITAYLAGRNGLSGNGADDGPRLSPIPRPIWPYPPEDPMTQYADQLDAILKQGKESARDLAALRKDLGDLAKKQAKSAEREKRTNSILRALRDDLAEAPTSPVLARALATIDTALEE